MNICTFGKINVFNVGKCKNKKLYFLDQVFQYFFSK